MKIKDIKSCPVCYSDKIKNKNKTTALCEDCGSKIGIIAEKMWYEYIIKKEDK